MAMALGITLGRPQVVAQEPPVGDVQVERRPGAGRARWSATTRGGSSRTSRRAISRSSTAGQARPITDFRHDLAGVSVALLFDVSGSMEAQHGERARSRDARSELARLTATKRRSSPSTRGSTKSRRSRAGCRRCRRRCRRVVPFGATSLHDAIARDRRARRRRARARRAVVVFTDGDDNASRLTPARCPAIASAIDVPVYIVGIVPSIDNPSADTVGDVGRAIGARRPAGDLADLDRRTRVRREHAGDSAASRRGRSSTSCVISISSRSNRAASRAGIRSWSACATRT